MDKETVLAFLAWLDGENLALCSETSNRIDGRSEWEWGWRPLSPADRASLADEFLADVSEPTPEQAALLTELVEVVQ